MTSAAQPIEVVAGYLNAYRILVSDLVVLTGAEEGSGYEELEHAIAGVKDVTVVPVVLRPRPAEPILGRRVAYFSTAPAEAHETLARHLREEHGADVALVSGNLARREALREDIATGGRGGLPGRDQGRRDRRRGRGGRRARRGGRVRRQRARPVGVPDLDTELIRLADSAIARVTVPR